MGWQDGTPVNAKQPAWMSGTPVDKASQIPGTALPPAPEPKPNAPEFLALPEAALSAATALGAGVIGNIAGVGKTLFSGKYGTPEGIKAGEETAGDVSRALTYQPRGEGAKKLLADLGEIGSASKLAGLGPAEGMMAGAAAGNTLSAVKPAVSNVINKVKPVFAAKEPAMAGMGAANTAEETIRRERAASFPVPIKLSKGEATRDFEQQRFEKETAKSSHAGAPLREHAADNVEKVIKNFESWVDQTGAEAPDLISVGKAVDRPLVRRMESAKAEIRNAYSKAEAAGDMAQPIDVTPLVKFIEENRSAARLAPVLTAAESELKRLGGAASSAPEVKPITGPGRSITQAVKDLGGVNSADGTMRDVTGESRAGVRVKGIPPALFTKNGLGLDDLASQLEKRGYHIAIDDVDGGVQSLKDMLADELNGRTKHYPRGNETSTGAKMLDDRAMEDIMRQHSDASSENAAFHGFDNEHPGYIKQQKAIDAQRDAAMSAQQGQFNEKPVGTPGNALRAGTLPINDVEKVRKLVVTLAKANETNGHYGAELNKVIDAMTEGQGGDLYKKARTMYKDYAAEFKGLGAVRRLVSNKPGTTDRSVALEDVFSHSVLKGSNQDTQNILRSLEKAGPEGLQGIKELKGATMNYLLSEATKNASRDIRGNPIPSFDKLNKAVRSLDIDGKLDLMFGKQGAAQIRDLKDLLADIHTAPPGAVNSSTTGAVLMEALGALGTGRIPTALAKTVAGIKQSVGDRALSKRVREALEEPHEQDPTGGRGSNVLH